jgi:hypothetical protein
MVPAPAVVMNPVSEEQPVPVGPIPATWTAAAQQAFAWPTSANLPSLTPRPTSLPIPSTSPTATSTNTPSPTATNTLTPTSTSPPPIIDTSNWLPNPSFEEGWYHYNGIPELQVANQWRLEWDEGENPLDSASWNRFVRPESRLLSRDFLPSGEHNTFIWDGDWTVKVFKREGALSFRLVTNVYLLPGSYLFEINAYPDMVTEYRANGRKVWASDPLAGELQFIVDVPASQWYLPTFGTKNTLTHAFEVTEARTYRIGVAFRGRWAILNNGWFMDDWSIQQLSEASVQ